MTKTTAIDNAKGFARTTANAINLATLLPLDYAGRLAIASGTDLASVYAGVPDRWAPEVRSAFTDTFLQVTARKVQAHQESVRRFEERYTNATTLAQAREIIEKAINASGVRGLTNVSWQGFDIRRGGGSWALAEVRIRVDSFGAFERTTSPIEGDARYYRAIKFTVDVRTLSNSATVQEATVQAAAYRDAIELAAELELVLNNLRPIAREDEY